VGSAQQKMNVERELRELRERLARVPEWEARRAEIEGELAKVWVEGVEGGEELVVSEKGNGEEDGEERGDGEREVEEESSEGISRGAGTENGSSSMVDVDMENGSSSMATS
jgi:ATP-binding cassette subfamily D (ALD) long-chain fatty acid import protein